MVQNKVQRILESNGVTLDAITDNALYFTVRSGDNVYDVTYDRRKSYWSCTCEHGSLWRGFKVNEFCAHIKACWKFLEGCREVSGKSVTSVFSKPCNSGKLAQAGSIAEGAPTPSAFISIEVTK